MSIKDLQMNKLIYLCNQDFCKKKSKTVNDFIRHMKDNHNIEISHQDVPPPIEINLNNLFYLCTEINCNKKFKTKGKLIFHLLKNHNKILEENNLPQPIELNKNNKKEHENNRNQLKKSELFEQKRKEIQRLQELEEKAKLEAEERFKEEKILKLKEIEEKKLEHKLKLLENKNKIISLEDNWINLMEKIQQREIGATNCGICFDNDADTAPIPCGHRMFCFDCITDYHKKYPNKGCPICRKEIVLIAKIYI